jgi:hypothetical protein
MYLLLRYPLSAALLGLPHRLLLAHSKEIVGHSSIAVSDGFHSLSGVYAMWKVQRGRRKVKVEVAL